MPIPPPAALLAYMEGLRTHDIGRIRSALADTLRFVTPVRAMDKAQTLAFLTALYVGFPDWHYDNDPPRPSPDGTWAVRWRQGGTHTGTLALSGFPPVPPTRRQVVIPEHDFYYKIAQAGLVEIRPDPVPGGAPRGIFEQIGVALPPL
jgi:SnoaL-like domain